jgi:hypothetical protein
MSILSVPLICSVSKRRRRAEPFLNLVSGDEAQIESPRKWEKVRASSPDTLINWNHEPVAAVLLLDAATPVTDSEDCLR